MTRNIAVLSLLVSLTACDQAKKAIDEAKEPEAKPVEPDPEPLELDVRNATVSMITVKNGDTEVPGKFEGVTGTLTFSDGAVPNDLTGSLTVDVSSWDSGLELRDDRVKATFFGIEDHSSASFRLVGIDGLPEAGIEIGAESEGTATGKLTFAGATAEVEAKVMVKRSGETDFHIDTVEPFVVSIETLGLTGPLKDLMKECEHKSIDDSVKVSVRLDLVEAGEVEAKPVNDGPKPVAATRDAQIQAREDVPATRAAQEGGKTISVPKATPPAKASKGKGKNKGKGKGKGKNNKKKR